MKNAFTSAKAAAEVLLSRIRSFGTGVGNAVSNIATDIPTYAASYRQQRIGPTIPLPSLEEVQKYEKFGGLWKTSPITALKQQLRYGPEVLDNFIEKSGSAEAAPRFVAPPDPAVDNLRQRVLSSSGFRPTMQQFLSSIPVVQRPIEQQGAWGTAQSGDSYYSGSDAYQGEESQTWEQPMEQPQRMIFMDPNAIKDPSGGEVLLHEYMHTAPRNMSLKKQFVQLAQRINPDTQPIIWNISMQYLRNGKPPPNTEEVYATLGQQLGPRALLIPEIREFYKNVFAQYTGGMTYSPFSKPELWKNGNLVE